MSALVYLSVDVCSGETKILMQNGCFLLLRGVFMNRIRGKIPEIFFPLQQAKSYFCLKLSQRKLIPMQTFIYAIKE